MSLHSNRRFAPPAARTAALLMLLGLAAFLGLTAAAMVLYPGGNWLDRHALGHRFWANFFCDLTQPVSLSGVANGLGSRLAQLGMLCFALALAGLFWLLPHQFGFELRAAPWVRVLGECSVLSFILVPLTPSEHFGNLHAALALVSSGFGVAAALTSVCALWAANRRWLAALGALTLAWACFDGTLFIYHLRDAAPPPLIVPAAQKVTAFALVAWIVSVAWSALLGHDGARAEAEQPKVLP